MMAISLIYACMHTYIHIYIYIYAHSTHVLANKHTHTYHTYIYIQNRYKILFNKIMTEIVPYLEKEMGI